MKNILKGFKIMIVLIGFSVFIGCKSDELPCKSAPQGDYELVE